MSLGRRAFCQSIAAIAIGSCARSGRAAGPRVPWRYVLGSCLYGTALLNEILAEAPKIGASHIDIWPRVHGDQREQIEKLGHDRFTALLAEAHVKVAAFSRFDLGPFGLDEELTVARRFGAPLVIAAGKGPVGLKGDELKSAVLAFAEKMRPHLALAERQGVTIAIENHGRNLIDSSDSLRWLAEFTQNQPLGLALAPYHLPQNPAEIAKLIEELGDRISLFYAWEHGRGSGNVPPDKQIEQLPGRGKLDFRPIVAALVKLEYRGFVEVFMHSTPRGTPIRTTTAAATSEINAARLYFESCMPT